MDAETYQYLMEGFVFVSGVPVRSGRIAFLAHSHPAMREGLSITQLLYLDDLTEWYDGSIHEWGAVGMARMPELNSLLVVGRDGEAARGIGEDMVEGSIEDKKGSVGPLRGIRNIDGRIFAYGLRRQIYLLGPDGRWTRYMNGLPSSEDDRAITSEERIKKAIEDMSGFNAVTGTSIAELYAVGIDGEIWRTHGDAWLRVDSPTNLMLTDATVSPDGTVYACGLSGVILRGRNDSWEAIAYEGPQGLGFRTVAWFRDSLYLADGHSVRRLEGQNLALVDFGVEGVVPAHYLYADAEMLLTVAGKEIYISADGVSWTAILN